jgi:predicted HTH domain antitoxin
METVQVQFEIPALLAAQVGLDLDNISQEVRRMVAMFLYEHKRISLSKACEIGNMSLWDFADLNRQLGITLNYTQADLNGDLAKLAHV